jgi:N-glycosylase/DNA lyase
MQGLEKKIKALMNSEVGAKAKERIKEFKEFENNPDEKWFSELCFCLLTANTSAEMGIRVQNKVSAEKFLSLPEKELASELKKAGSRFYNRRAEFICAARKFEDIKEILSSMPEKEKRNFLVKNIKGFGLKEASHFLRNTGNLNYAIIDKHVLNVCVESELAGKKQKKLDEKNYFELEEKLKKIALKLNISLGELDLFLWFSKTGKILK